MCSEAKRWTDCSDIFENRNHPGLCRFVAKAVGGRLVEIGWRFAGCNSALVSARPVLLSRRARYGLKRLRSRGSEVPFVRVMRARETVAPLSQGVALWNLSLRNSFQNDLGVCGWRAGRDRGCCLRTRGRSPAGRFVSGVCRWR